MARFYIEETFGPDGARVELHRIEPIDPAQAARLIARGMLKADDERTASRKVGEFTLDYPAGGFPKKVRRAALEWLREHEGMTDADSFEIQIATQDAREVLARIEAALSA